MGKTVKSSNNGDGLRRQAVNNALERHFFNIPSFKIYGGAAGLYDYGPPGATFLDNVLSLWRQHFVLEENMLQVNCPSVTPEIVLKASGHVDKFTDLKVEDMKTGKSYRADHLLKDYCEDTLAEIEHFVDPEDKSHPKYATIANLEILMLSSDEQISRKSEKRLRLGEAVSKGIVNNQTLAYFIGRVYLFLIRLGIDEERLRFRQHLPNEMAHYAEDCWDAEIKSSYGWIECVRIADRSAYDLRAHSEKSGIALVAREKFAEPKEVEKLTITPVKKELELAFKGNQKMVLDALEAMNEHEAMAMKAALESKGEVEFQVSTLQKTVTIKKNMVSITKEIKKEHQRVFTPSVIEPSFRIGRIICCLFEHCFYTRPSKDGYELLNVFRFPPLVAPIKCSVFPLVQNQKYEEVVELISTSLIAAGIFNEKDTTGTSIGKKYARADELGVPFAITVDSTSSVTIRERDSKDQIRLNVEEVVAVVKDVSEGQSTWADILKKYPESFRSWRRLKTQIYARPTLSLAILTGLLVFEHCYLLHKLKTRN